jgi:hypothetical protein
LPRLRRVHPAPQWQGRRLRVLQGLPPWRDRAPLDARARAAYIEQARFYPAELTGGPDDDTESRKRAAVALSTRVARAVDDHAVSEESLRDALTTLRSGSVDRAE